MADTIGALVARSRLWAIVVPLPGLWAQIPAGVGPSAESFLATLKRELINRRDYHSRDQARLSIRWWIEARYNPCRLHSTIGHQPLNEREDSHYHHTATQNKVSGPRGNS